jgi:hypothetical protein
MTSLTGTFQTDLPMPDALAACAEGVHGLGWKLESVQPSQIVSHANSGTDRAAKVEVSLSEAGSGTEVRITGSDSEGTPLSEEQLIGELDKVRDAIETAVKESSASAESEPEPSTDDGGDADDAVDEPEPEQRTEEREVPATESDADSSDDADDGDGAEVAENAAVAAAATEAASGDERRDEDDSDADAKPASDTDTGTEQAAEMAPAGWYEDYDGPGERYWDGETWTDQVREKGQLPFDHEQEASAKQAAPDAAQTEDKEKKPSPRERRRRRAEERRRLAEEERQRAEEEQQRRAAEQSQADQQRQTDETPEVEQVPQAEVVPQREEVPQRDEEPQRRAEPQPVAAALADGHSVSKDLIWALSLAFGAVSGSAAVFNVPDASFYIPLCFGIAALALAVAAFTTKGKTPWWAVVAVIAALGGTAIGVHDYSNYKDAKDKLDNAQKQLQQITP